MQWVGGLCFLRGIGVCVCTHDLYDSQHDMQRVGGLCFLRGMGACVCTHDFYDNQHGVQWVVVLYALLRRGGVKACMGACTHVCIECADVCVSAFVRIL